MRTWLAAATMACGLLGATGAGATTFIQNLTIAPQFTKTGETRAFATGSATFEPVTLHLGDQLDINVDFGGSLTIPDYSFDSSFIWASITSFVGPLGHPYPYIAPEFINGASGYTLVVSAVPISPTEKFDPNTSLTVDGTAFLFESVPEPTTWAMMVAGCSLAGMAFRRQRRPAKA